MPTTRCCTQRKIGPVVVEDEVVRHTMKAVDKSRIRGIIEMPTVVDPP